MKSSTGDELVRIVSEMDLHDLMALEKMVKVAIRMRTQSTLSMDSEESLDREDEGPSLADEARFILEDLDTYDLTLADQALLASLILSDAYQQDSFSSRAVNDVIAECGRPRVANITSAISALKGRSFVQEEEKALSLTREGRVKARALIGMLKRKAAA